MHLVPDLGREMQMMRMVRAMQQARPIRRIPQPAEVMALTIPLLAFAIRSAPPAPPSRWRPGACARIAPAAS